MIARAFERLYAFLLYAYPPDLRRSHGADMRQCARAALATRGAAAVPRLVADLSVSVPREWTVALSDLSLKGRGVPQVFDEGGQAGRIDIVHPGEVHQKNGRLFAHAGLQFGTQRRRGVQVDFPRYPQRGHAIVLGFFDLHA